MTQEEFERLVKAANQHDQEAIEALGKAGQQGDLRAIYWMLGMYLKFGKFKTSLYSDVSHDVNAVREMLKKMQVDRVLVEKDYDYTENSPFKSLSEVYIPEGTTRIGEYAFSWCKFTYVYIPNSVTSIGKGAFDYCGRLTSITIPDSVKNIEKSFHHCGSLNSIIVASGNTKYDSRDNCNAIIETATNTLIAGCQNTIIPHSVTSIGDGAFYNCSSLTSVTIPNSVTRIGCCAFESCGKLTSIIVPNSVTIIDEFAFSSCYSLTSITISNSVISIERGNFFDCDNLSKIIVPKGTKSRFEQMECLKNLADKIVEE